MVRNITLSAEERAIRRARERAAREKRSLNTAFRQWLNRYAGPGNGEDEYRDLMKRLRHVRAGRKFSREEMNGR